MAKILTVRASPPQSKNDGRKPTTLADLDYINRLGKMQPLPTSAELDESAAELISLTNDTPTPSVEQGTMQAAIANATDKLLATELSAREQQIVKLVYGFGDNDEPRKLIEVARIVGCSHQNVRQTRIRALAKLHYSAAANRLRSLSQDR